MARTRFDTARQAPDSFAHSLYKPSEHVPITFDLCQTGTAHQAILKNTQNSRRLGLARMVYPALCEGDAIREVFACVTGNNLEGRLFSG